MRIYFVKINFTIFFTLLRVLVFLVKSDFTNFLDLVADLMKKLFSYIFLPWGIQHANNTNKSQINFIFGKLGRIVQVHFLRVHWGITSGQSQTSQSITSSTIGNSPVGEKKNISSDLG